MGRPVMDAREPGRLARVGVQVTTDSIHPYLLGGLLWSVEGFPSVALPWYAFVASDPVLRTWLGFGELLKVTTETGSCFVVRNELALHIRIADQCEGGVVSHQSSPSFQLASRLVSTVWAILHSPVTRRLLTLEAYSSARHVDLLQHAISFSQLTSHLAPVAGYRLPGYSSTKNSRLLTTRS